MLDLGSIDKNDYAENKEKLFDQWLLLAFLKEKTMSCQFDRILNQIASVSAYQIAFLWGGSAAQGRNAGFSESRIPDVVGVKEIVVVFTVEQGKLSLQGQVRVWGLCCCHMTESWTDSHPTCTREQKEGGVKAATQQQGEVLTVRLFLPGYVLRSPTSLGLLSHQCSLLHIAGHQHYSISEILASYTPTNLSLIRNVNRILSADIAFSTF